MGLNNKKWLENMATVNINQTKLKNNGRLINLYHMTPAGGFKYYHPLSHFGTSKAANMRGLHYLCSANKEVKIGNVESMEEIYKLLSTSPDTPSLSMQKVHLYMKHPITVEDWGDHRGIAGWKNWFSHDYEPKAIYLNHSEFMEQCDASEQHKRYNVALTTRYKKLLTQFIFVEPFKTLTPEEVKQELNAENLFKPKDEQTDRESLAMQRLIRFLEGEGYDGFRYVNDHEDRGSTSYIIFRPWQVFNALVPETKHELPKLTEKQSAFLLTQEQKFFHPSENAMDTASVDKGLSPSERIKRHAEQKAKHSIKTSRKYPGLVPQISKTR